MTMVGQNIVLHKLHTLGILYTYIRGQNIARYIYIYIHSVVEVETVARA